MKKNTKVSTKEFITLIDECKDLINKKVEILKTDYRMLDNITSKSDGFRVANKAKKEKEIVINELQGLKNDLYNLDNKLELIQVYDERLKVINNDKKIANEELTKLVDKPIDSKSTAKSKLSYAEKIGKQTTIISSLENEKNNLENQIKDLYTKLEAAKIHHQTFGVRFKSNINKKNTINSNEDLFGLKIVDSKPANKKLLKEVAKTGIVVILLLTLLALGWSVLKIIDFLKNRDVVLPPEFATNITEILNNESETNVTTNEIIDNIIEDEILEEALEEITEDEAFNYLTGFIDITNPEVVRERAIEIYSKLDHSRVQFSEEEFINAMFFYYGNLIERNYELGDILSLANNAMVATFNMDNMFLVNDITGRIPYEGYLNATICPAYYFTDDSFNLPLAQTFGNLRREIFEERNRTRGQHPIRTHGSQSVDPSSRLYALGVEFTRMKAEFLFAPVTGTNGVNIDGKYYNLDMIHNDVEAFTMLLFFHDFPLTAILGENFALAFLNGEYLPVHLDDHGNPMWPNNEKGHRFETNIDQVNVIGLMQMYRILIDEECVLGEDGERMRNRLANAYAAMIKSWDRNEYEKGQGLTLTP